MSALVPSKSSSYIGFRSIQQSQSLQRSSSEVVISRGFKPSDTQNPKTTKFLTDLSQKIWGRSLEASGHKVNIEDGLQNKQIDLEKLFTPASDSGEITPSRNRKLFASSSFYAPYHPTMEEQVELARRISHSLSDISNKESKGQSMYVNRKKRSVKWVHEGEGKLPEPSSETENLEPTPQNKKEGKPPLKLVMNPRGQVQDISTLRKQGYAFDSPMSPEVCLDLVRDLNAPRGKGAELFAKRRKKSEKWIIDENNVKTIESHPASSTPLSKLPPPSYLKDSTHRVENVQKMNQIQERFTLPRLKMIKSPWEAALEGSVENAFQEINSPRGTVMAPTPTTLRKLATPTPPLPTPYAPVKEELYKPKPPKAWNPQPTCKSFSSVKLEKIFAGSPKSPVSLAYHPDTNTISTEPVIIEQTPAIATELAGYEVFDKSILHDKKVRRPENFLIYDASVISSTSTASVTKQSVETSEKIQQIEKIENEIKENVTTSVVSKDENIEEKINVVNVDETSKVEETVKQVETKNEVTKEEQKDLKKPEEKETVASSVTEETKNQEIKEENVVKSDIVLEEKKYESEMISKKEENECVVKKEIKVEEMKNFEENVFVENKEKSYIERELEEFNSREFNQNITKTKVIAEKDTMSVDQEVEDLCEREFNELSLEYEKVNKHEVKKPAVMVAGAMPIFDPSTDFSVFKQDKVEETKQEEVKERRYKKPGSQVPGAKPLFGEAVDIHLSLDNNNGLDKPYEKIPVKSLINSFEQSTRPVMKYKQIQESIPPVQSPNKMIRMEEPKGTITTTQIANTNVTSTETNAFNNTQKGNEQQMSKEEIEKIEHHYELLKEKRDIYDQQMQKYKEEMKQLRSIQNGGSSNVSASKNTSLYSRTQQQQQQQQQQYDAVSTVQNYMTTKTDITTSYYQTEQQQQQQMSLQKASYSSLQEAGQIQQGDVGHPSLRIEEPSIQTAPSAAAAVPPPPITTTTSAPPSTVSNPSYMNYTSLNNFNTAPRGWQSTMSYYRPVTFNATSTYTDF